jgi:beta-1,4-mannosyl-glycoprotein beta-1,4-N-acetylglucosaminyltransferase
MKKISSSEGEATMIYDCFTFYNELDLLEVRLHELCDVVDRFVLVEATQTFQGNPKPLYFEEHKDAFSRYADKITHIIVEFPDERALRSQLSTRPSNMTWAREHYQRDQISRGLKALPDDLIIVSDVDEIISAAKLRGAIAGRRPHDLTIFAMSIYTGCVNRRVTGSVWEKGPRMIEFSDFTGAEHLRLTKMVATNHLGNSPLGRFYTRYQNYMLRGIPSRIHIVPDSGWHMTSIGDWDRYRSKILAFSHSEAAEEERFKCMEAFERRLAETTSAVDPRELPKFIQENLQRFTLAT